MYKTLGSGSTKEHLGEYLGEHLNEGLSRKLKPALNFALAVTAISVLAGCSDSGGGNRNGLLSGGGGGEIPVNDATPLTDLFGRVSFPFSFFNAESEFNFEATFGEDDLVSNDNGDLFLLDTVEGFRKESAGSGFEATGPETMVCNFEPTSEAFLCTVFFDDDSEVLFTFGRLVNNASQGNFTHCPAELSTLDCINELLTTPDGSVNVVTQTQIAARGVDFHGLDAANNSRNIVDIQPYLAYQDQGSTNAPRSSLVNPEFSALLSAELEKHKAL